MSSGAGGGITAARTLFGSIFGLGAGEARAAAIIALAALAVMLLIARPLLFLSVSPQVARARGVPARLLGIGFLALLGVVAAEATQAVGALLLLGLLAAPAAAAHRLLSRPFASIALAGLLAVLAMWGGLTLAYWVPALPPSSAVIGIAVGDLLPDGGVRMSSGAGSSRRRRRSRPPGASAAVRGARCSSCSPTSAAR